MVVDRAAQHVVRHNQHLGCVLRFLQHTQKGVAVGATAVFGTGAGGEGSTLELVSTRDFGPRLHEGVKADAHLEWVREARGVMCKMAAHLVLQSTLQVRWIGI